MPQPKARPVRDSPGASRSSIAPGMRRIALLVLAAALAAGCSEAGSATDISSHLRMRVWPHGLRQASQTWTLRCNPLGGTLPHGDRACYELAAGHDLFEPTPPDRACTQVYGGPAVAAVQGSIRGRLVSARFKRTDGCEIARWDRVRFLFPGVRREP